MWRGFPGLRKGAMCQVEKEMDRQRVHREEIRFMWYKSQENYDKWSKCVRARQIKTRRKMNKILHDVLKKTKTIYIIQFTTGNVRLQS